MFKFSLCLIAVITAVVVASHVIADPGIYPKQRRLKPIAKKTVKEILGPNDLGPEDITQIIPSNGEGLGYYFERHRRRLKTEGVQEVEFYYLTLFDVNYDHMFDFFMDMLRWQAEGDVTQKIYDKLPHLSAYLQSVTTARRQIFLYDMGDYQKYVVRVQLDRYKVAANYPEIRLVMEKTLKLFQVTLADQYGDKLMQLTVDSPEWVEFVFLKDHEGSLVTADENWCPVTCPDNPTEFKKYNWEWLSPDFTCFLTLSVIMDVRVLYILKLFHLDLPALTMRVDMEKKPDSVTLTLSTVDVQIKSAELGGVNSELLINSALGLKDNLKGKAALWAKNNASNDYTILRAGVSSQVDDYWLFNWVLSALENFCSSFMKDMVKPITDIMIALKKDIIYLEETRNSAGPTAIPPLNNSKVGF